jgi:hypothetical protein
VSENGFWLKLAFLSLLVREKKSSLTISKPGIYPILSISGVRRHGKWQQPGDQGVNSR